MSNPRRGWIIPYLPPVFTLKDFRKRSIMTSVEARAYLARRVKEGRLRLVEDDVYAKVGRHLCIVHFKADGTPVWGEDFQTRVFPVAV